MSKNKPTLNQEAWLKLFDEHDILKEIKSNGKFIISADAIKKYREPRLMCKFDHSLQLPEIFAKNHLSILPISRGKYMISHFKNYAPFKESSLTESSSTEEYLPIHILNLPDHIQSLGAKKISSESIALNSAYASGMIADFVKDELILPTVSGRSSSQNFDFYIDNLASKVPHQVSVSNSQIEIDAAYEGKNCLALFEAKLTLSEDFLIRQLYYPYRLWHGTINKPVRSFLMAYSNSIYHLYEYCFKEPNNYNSLKLVNQKRYSIENTKIMRKDLEEVLKRTPLIAEPRCPFPQADSFPRVINICELLGEYELTRDDVTDRNQFDERQADYYTNAAIYLGLIKKTKNDGKTTFVLTEKGKETLSLNYKQRQLTFCSQILEHKPFNEVFKLTLQKDVVPKQEVIVRIMKGSNLYQIQGDETFRRRAQTIQSWIKWMLNLIIDPVR